MAGKTKRLGIVGGLGPETSSRFCLEINRRFRELTGQQPDFVLENVPVPTKLESEIIGGGDSWKMLGLLGKAVLNLNNNGADVIVIPCNSVHVFINHLRKVSGKPIISIIEECAKKCQEAGVRKVGLLATQKTIDGKLFSNELATRKIEVITPRAKAQKRVNKIILRIINSAAESGDKGKLLEIIDGLAKKGAEGVILGCTDLSLLLSETDCNIAVFDTCKILQEASIREMV